MTLLSAGVLPNRLPAAPPTAATDSGRSVVVIYNSAMPESREVAEYYARRRGVPAEQIWGFKLPTGEAIFRKDFVAGLVRPVWERLVSSGLWKLAPTTNTVGLLPPEEPFHGQRVAESKIRYALLCYGVPIRVVRDNDLKEPGAEKIAEPLRRNEASVDSDLACLPLLEQGLNWTAPVRNQLYRQTNAVLLHPTNHLLMVTRLDGPSPEIARRLVDLAMEAETNGLWGRCYFDGRGITNGSYRIGDDWLRQSAFLTHRLGFDTYLDQKPATLPPSFPMSHIAVYAGWYDGEVSGPFTRPRVEFMPGAFAYHLHSYSAHVVRTTNQFWVGPLLAKGATITMGCVEEPYLQMTPDVATFLVCLMYYGFSFGEAAYSSQSALSWQTIAVGDPLYRPFGRRPQDIQADLEKRHSPLVAWCHHRLINLNLVSGTSVDQAIAYLRSLPITRKSPILLEKLAELYWASKRLTDAVDTYAEALKQHPSPQQKIRLWLTLAERREQIGPDTKAYELYRDFLKEVPDYPDRLTICRKLRTLAEKLGKTAEARHWQEEIKRLTPLPAP